MRRRRLAGLVLMVLAPVAAHAAGTCLDPYLTDPVAIGGNLDGINDLGAASAWSGSTLAVATSAYNTVNEWNIYVQILARSGQPITAKLPLMDTPDDYLDEPTIAWNGSGFAVAWDDSTDLYFARVDVLGGKVGSVVRLTDEPGGSFYPSLAWNGSGYGIAWEDYRHDDLGEIYFARFDAEGRRVGEEMRLTTNGSVSYGVSLAWNGGGYGVAWVDDMSGAPQLHFMRLTTDGRRVGSDSTVSGDGGDVFSSVLRWTGTGYGVAWQQRTTPGDDTRLHFASLSSTGNVLAGPVDLASAPYLPFECVWTGAEFGLLWATPSTVTGATLVAARLDRNAGRLGADLVVADGTNSNDHTLAWTGRDYRTTYTTFGSHLTRTIACACDDTVDVDGDGSGACTDCDDARPDVHPGATETCDGADEDCDDTIDEGILICGIGACQRIVAACSGGGPAVCVPGQPEAETCNATDDDCDGRVDDIPACDGVCSDPDVVAASGSVSQGEQGLNVSIAWTGSGYGIAYWEYDGDLGLSRVMFALLDRTGAVLRRTAVSDYGWYIGTTATAWNGSGFGVAWDDWNQGDGDVRFRVLDAAGTLLGPVEWVTNTPTWSGYPSLVWNGTDYAIAWEDARDDPAGSEIYFARFDASGSRLGPDRRLTDSSGYSFDPSLVWTGDGYGLVWDDNRDGSFKIYFSRLDAAGTAAPGALRLSENESYLPVLAWTGAGYGAAWFDLGNPIGIRFALLAADGSPLASPVFIAASDWAGDRFLVWTGGEFAMTYAEIQDVFVVRLHPDGTLSGLPVRIDRSSQHAGNSTIVWNGTSPLVAFEFGLPDSRYEVRVRAVTCGCPDRDGDGFSSCLDCDDGVPTTFPGRPEICNNGVDDDCDTTVDELAQHDTDGDGIDNACDVCALSRDPAQADVDADGRGDACDICPVAYDPRQEDVDADGIGDLCDSCMRARHPQATDRDGDGTGDVCDRDDGAIFVMPRDEGTLVFDTEIGYERFNIYFGDVATLKTTGIYTQAPSMPPAWWRFCGWQTSGQPNEQLWAGNTPDPGRAWFFLVTGVQDGVEGSLGRDSSGAERPNANPCSPS